MNCKAQLIPVAEGEAGWALLVILAVSGCCQQHKHHEKMKSERGSVDTSWLGSIQHWQKVALESYQKSEKSDLGQTLEIITYVRTYCIFACFYLISFTGADALAIALLTCWPWQQTAPPSLNLAAWQSCHFWVSLSEITTPATATLAPAHCTISWGSAQKSKWAWPKAMWWKNAQSVFTSPHLRPQTALCFWQRSTVKDT